MGKDLLLIRGHPGCGKSTLAKVLVNNAGNAKEVATDDYMVDEEGNYLFDWNKLSLCHGKCQVCVEDWMISGVDLIVVHNTFTGNWEMGAYFESAATHGYRVHVVKKEGEYGSIHGVPVGKINQMKRNYEPFDPKKVRKRSSQ
jgi:energy-coupling factor transporter ATP-binding protein EcfA2